MRARTCPHFSTCGGCSLLTTPLDEQRREKERRVLATLGPHWQGATRWTDDGGSADHARLRVLLPVQPDSDRGVTMGLYERGSHRVVELESCAIQDPRLTRLGQHALRRFRASGLAPYDERSARGDLRAFSARLSATTGELLLGVITTGREVPGGLVDGLLEDAATLEGVTPVGVVRNTNAAPGNALIGRDTRTLRGRDHLFDRVAHLQFRIGFGSFYQLHRDSDALLYRPAMAMLGDLSGARVVDGFGGVGTFALRAARAGAAAVTLVEANPSSCADARFNAGANSLPDVRVEEGPFAKHRSSPDVVMVDPNRAGLGADGCAALATLAAPTVLYVSCGLRALRRDLDALPQYRIRDLRLADLFPHTDHVEALALLSRRD